jgi:hypothetical protein
MYQAKGTQVQRRNSRSRQQEPPQRIVATYEMDTKTFVRHFSMRHKVSLSGMDALPDNIDYNVEQAYRAFHRRLHTTEQLAHYHDPDPPEAAIDRCIELIIQNRDWGWKEIADIHGHFAAFPDGKIATRVDGSIVYHGDISEATDRLIAASNAARDKIKKAARR